MGIDSHRHLKQIRGTTGAPRHLSKRSANGSSVVSEMKAVIDQLKGSKSPSTDFSARFASFFNGLKSPEILTITAGLKDPESSFSTQLNRIPEHRADFMSALAERGSQIETISSNTPRTDDVDWRHSHILTDSSSHERPVTRPRPKSQKPQLKTIREIPLENARFNITTFVSQMTPETLAEFVSALSTSSSPEYTELDRWMPHERQTLLSALTERGASCPNSVIEGMTTPSFPLKPMSRLRRAISNKHGFNKVRLQVMRYVDALARFSPALGRISADDCHRYIEKGVLAIEYHRGLSLAEKGQLTEYFLNDLASLESGTNVVVAHAGLELFSQSELGAAITDLNAIRLDFSDTAEIIHETTALANVHLDIIHSYLSEDELAVVSVIQALGSQLKEPTIDVFRDICGETESETYTINQIQLEMARFGLETYTPGRDFLLQAIRRLNISESRSFIGKQSSYDRDHVTPKTPLGHFAYLTFDDLSSIMTTTRDDGYLMPWETTFVQRFTCSKTGLHYARVEGYLPSSDGTYDRPFRAEGVYKRGDLPKREPGWYLKNGEMTETLSDGQEVRYIGSFDLRYRLQGPNCSMTQGGITYTGTFVDGRFQSGSVE